MTKHSGIFRQSDVGQAIADNNWVGTMPAVVEYLVVAGGGGGGSGYGSGAGSGGGAGGLLAGFSGVAIGSAITVTVGGGGSGAASSADSTGSTGANSVFGNFTALGGGGAGSAGTTGGGLLQATTRHAMPVHRPARYNFCNSMFTVFGCGGPRGGCILVSHCPFCNSA